MAKKWHACHHNCLNSVILSPILTNKGTKMFYSSRRIDWWKDLSSNSFSCCFIFILAFLLLKTGRGALNWLDHLVFEKLNVFILIMCLYIYNFAPLKTTPKFKATFSSFWAQYSPLLILAFFSIFIKKFVQKMW